MNPPHIIKGSLIFYINAIQEGDTDKLKSLLIECLDNKYYTHESIVHPLYFAVETGRMELVETVLNHGSEIDFRDEEGRTPLHRAAGSFSTPYLFDGVGISTTEDQMKRVEIVSKLISYGADVNAKDKQGRTPLQSAVRMNFYDIADLLRQHGAK